MKNKFRHNRAVHHWLHGLSVTAQVNVWSTSRHRALFLAIYQPATGAFVPLWLSRANLDNSLQCIFTWHENLGGLRGGPALEVCLHLFADAAIRLCPLGCTLLGPIPHHVFEHIPAAISVWLFLSSFLFFFSFFSDDAKNGDRSVRAQDRQSPLQCKYPADPHVVVYTVDVTP